MLRIRVTVEGRSPLMMDPMEDAVLEGLRTKATVPQPRDLTVRQAAEKKLYRDKEGQIGIQRLNLETCLVQSGVFHKLAGNLRITNDERSLLPGLLSIEEAFLPLTGGAHWVPDKRRGNNTSGRKKVAICIVRPRFDQWGFVVTIRLNEKRLSHQRAKLLFIDAGDLIGLCAARQKGWFGRFRVVGWEVIEKIKDEGEEAMEETEAPRMGRRRRATAVAV